MIPEYMRPLEPSSGCKAEVFTSESNAMTLSNENDKTEEWKELVLNFCTDSCMDDDERGPIHVCEELTKKLKNLPEEDSALISFLILDFCVIAHSIYAFSAVDVPFCYTLQLRN